MRSMALARMALAAALLVPVGAGCDRILGVDGDYTVGGGNGATGGATASASSGSGSGGAAGADCTPEEPGGFTEGMRCPLDMVDTGSFCIDAREVNFSQYLDIVDRRPRACFEENLRGDSTCAGNEPFNIDEATFRSGSDHMPAHPLDYCDAEAYCRLRGRTLCTSDEWRSACSADPGQPFPWGGDPTGGHCIDHPFIEPVDRENNTCRRGDALSAIVDMPGNVAEFVFDCGTGTCQPCSDDLNCVVAGALLAAVDGGTPPDTCDYKGGAAHRTGIGDHEVVAELRTGARCCYHPPR